MTYAPDQRDRIPLGAERTVEIERHDGTVDTFPTTQPPWTWRDFLCVGNGQGDTGCDYIPMKSFRSFTVIGADQS